MKRPAASSGARNLPRHGLTAEGVISIKLGEKNKTGLPTYLKVANPARLVAEGSPARAGAQRSERSKGGDSALGDSKGRSPWRFFGDFLIGEKVTRVQGGAPAGGCRSCQLCEIPRGWHPPLVKNNRTIGERKKDEGLSYLQRPCAK